MSRASTRDNPVNTLKLRNTRRLAVHQDHVDATGFQEVRRDAGFETNVSDGGVPKRPFRTAAKHTLQYRQPLMQTQHIHRRDNGTVPPEAEPRYPKPQTVWCTNAVDQPTNTYHKRRIIDTNYKPGGGRRTMISDGIYQAVQLPVAPAKQERKPMLEQHAASTGITGHSDKATRSYT